MYKAIVNNVAFDVLVSGEGYSVAGQPLEVDIAVIRDRHIHILHNDKGFRAEVIKVDRDARTFTIRVNGKSRAVIVKDKFDQLLEQMGMKTNEAGKINTIKAPMPGLIVEVKVQEGEAVQKNTPLLVLEAMKMENIIKSPGDGVVRSIRVRKGSSVEKNQVLIEF